MANAAATLLWVVATGLLALTVLSLAAAGATVVLPRARRYLRMQRPNVGVVSRIRR
jgi:hypothetical protein